jgi:hypothetical protein
MNLTTSFKRRFAKTAFHSLMEEYPYAAGERGLNTTLRGSRGRRGNLSSRTENPSLHLLLPSQPYTATTAVFVDDFDAGALQHCLDCSERRHAASVSRSRCW